MTAGFVIRTGGACAAERLLPDGCARRLVVDVEVTRSVKQTIRHHLYRRAILREDRSRERVGEVRSQMAKVSSSFASS